MIEVHVRSFNETDSNHHFDNEQDNQMSTKHYEENGDNCDMDSLTISH